MQFGSAPANWPSAPRGGNVQHPVQPVRRKWSDWSKCSSDCKKTRHRLNCDDLLAAPTADSQTLNATKASSLKKRQVSPSFRRPKVLLAKRQVNGDKRAEERDEDDDGDDVVDGSMSPAPLSSSSRGHERDEEEDYADEGDEENETDSCDKVEPSRTYQEVACRGDSCRLSSSSLSLGAPNSIIGSSTRRRLDSKQTPSPANKVHNRANQDSVRWQQQQQQDSLASLAAQEDKRPSSSSSNGSRLAAPEEPPAIWMTTKSMWPPKLGASGPGGSMSPQDSVAYAVQWTILLGALLTVVLLVALILRKLFQAALPSYHWMLAKQTIKSGANAYAVADCCNHPAGSLSCPHSSSTASSSSSPMAVATTRGHHAGLHPFSSRSPAARYPQQQSTKRGYCVDAQGRAHLLAQHQQHQLHQQQQLELELEPPTYMEPYSELLHQHHNGGNCNESHRSATTSSSGAYSRFAGGGGGARSDGGHSLRSTAAAANYDTLNRASEKGFLLTRDFVPYPGGDQADEEEPEDAEEPEDGDGQVMRPQRTIGPVRPVSRLSNSVDANQEEEDDEGSRSPPSTTAQMLSQAASSSFEQPPELPSDACSSPFPPPPAMSSSSATASPWRPRHQQSAKLVGAIAPSNVAKSQPSSPMFANQFRQQQQQARRACQQQRSLSHENQSAGAGSSSNIRNSNDQKVAKLVQELEAAATAATNCDRSHHYESLDEHRLNE